MHSTNHLQWCQLELKVNVVKTHETLVKTHEPLALNEASFLVFVLTFCPIKFYAFFSLYSTILCLSGLYNITVSIQITIHFWYSEFPELTDYQFGEVAFVGNGGWGKQRLLQNNGFLFNTFTFFGGFFPTHSYSVPSSPFPIQTPEGWVEIWTEFIVRIKRKKKHKPKTKAQVEILEVALDSHWHYWFADNSTHKGLQMYL